MPGPSKGRQTNTAGFLNAGAITGTHTHTADPIRILEGGQVDAKFTVKLSQTLCIVIYK